MGRASRSVLTFTPANALTPQIVVVNAANDAVGEGNHTALSRILRQRRLGLTTGYTIAGVTVAIVDNDAPTIVINEVDADPNGHADDG